MTASREHDDAAGHLEEHGTLESLVEILPAHHLPVLAQQTGIMAFQSCLHLLRQLG